MKIAIDIIRSINIAMGTRIYLSESLVPSVTLAGTSPFLLTGTCHFALKIGAHNFRDLEEF